MADDYEVMLAGAAAGELRVVLSELRERRSRKILSRIYSEIDSGTADGDRAYRAILELKSLDDLVTKLTSMSKRGTSAGKRIASNGPVESLDS